ncbi:MAG: hypothetical protein OES47_04295 [Acidobacteriota bacterium]|nr:hypothetical protein [Acidobacteriota bacterium]
MTKKNAVPFAFCILALAGCVVLLVAAYVQEGDHVPIIIFLAVSLLTTVLAMSTAFFVAKMLFKSWLTEEPKGGWWRGALTGFVVFFVSCLGAYHLALVDRNVHRSIVDALRETVAVSVIATLVAGWYAAIIGCIAGLAFQYTSRRRAP